MPVGVRFPDRCIVRSLHLGFRDVVEALQIFDVPRQVFFDARVQVAKGIGVLPAMAEVPQAQIRLNSLEAEHFALLRLGSLKERGRLMEQVVHRVVQPVQVRLGRPNSRLTVLLRDPAPEHRKAGFHCAIQLEHTQEIPSRQPGDGRAQKITRGIEGELGVGEHEEIVGVVDDHRAIHRDRHLEMRNTPDRHFARSRASLRDTERGLRKYR